MVVAPSCPALLIHGDDAFRKSLIATLDQRHFSVTVAGDDREGIDAIGSRAFHVIVVAVDLRNGSGLGALDYLRDHRGEVAGVIAIGEPNPELRTRARSADETLLKPVDPAYVATRASTYCRH